MITQLKLESWRAFDTLEVTFREGVTFVVAPNGIGKTSLLLGLTWAVFGDHAGFDPTEHVRLGQERAAVTVTVADDGVEIEIHRTVTDKGRRTNEYRVDGEFVTDQTGEQALADVFGAPLSVAAKLAIIHSAGNEALDLKDHLLRAFGVSQLLDAAEVAEGLHNGAVKRRRSLRTEAKQRLQGRQQLEEDASRLRIEVRERHEARQALIDRVQGLRLERRAADAWQRHRQALGQYDERVRNLLERIANHDQPPGDLQEMVVRLEERVARSRQERQRATDELDAARAQELAAISAIEVLDGPHPDCPTCARRFEEGGLEHAVALQRASAEVARAQAETVRKRLAAIEASLERSSAVLNEADGLRHPPAAPVEPRPTRDPAILVGPAEEEVRHHDEGTGSLSRQLTSITDALISDEELHHAQDRETVAWRHEALTQATAESLRAAATRIADEQLVPLSDQVRWRWKALFGEDGLQLRADGSLVRLVGDRELPWAQLSGGERIWSRVVAGLLVLQASTTLPFACIDEPLEHLDPRARRAVAADLANVPTRGRPQQMIVTTYEHGIARQIVADSDASLLVLRHSPDR